MKYAIVKVINHGDTIASEDIHFYLINFIVQTHHETLKQVVLA